MPRFRSVPSAVHDSPEWARASALARLAHRCLRPSAGELVLAAAREGEPTWSQFQRKAAECGAAFSVEESAEIVAACVAAGLWTERDGRLVIGAFPPSFEAQRTARQLGPRGGLSPAEKMRAWRERRAQGEVSVTTPSSAPPVTAPNGNSDRTEDPSKPLPAPAPTPPFRGGEGGTGEAKANGNNPIPATSPAKQTTDLRDVPRGQRAAVALALLGEGLGSAVWSGRADGDELAALEAILAAPGWTTARVDGLNAYLRAAGPEARKLFLWDRAVSSGAVPMTLGLLLGKARPDGTRKAGGLGRLCDAAQAWAAKRAPTKAVSTASTAPTPGVVKAPSMSREEFMAATKIPAAGGV